MTADPLREWLTTVGAEEGVEPFLTWAPPGHFYSPVPCARDLTRLSPRDDVPGIDLRTEAQLELLAEIGAHASGFLPPDEPRPDWRYHAENPMFAIGDALALQAMLRIRRPDRVIEVGSGWSSAVMLDTAERFLERCPELIFIEPYPANLDALLREEDRAEVTVHPRPVQDVDIDLFSSLGPGDILFIDSSHVVKPGSDVNYLYFDVLPRLAPGVAVHVHDIFFPFEIPDSWLAEGRMWGETYLLRALLTGASEWAILLWNDYLGTKHHDAVMAALRAAEPNTGASIWIERRARV